MLAIACFGSYRRTRSGRVIGPLAYHSECGSRGMGSNVPCISDVNGVAPAFRMEDGWYVPCLCSPALPCPVSGRFRTCGSTFPFRSFSASSPPAARGCDAWVRFFRCPFPVGLDPFFFSDPLGKGSIAPARTVPFADPELLVQNQDHRHRKKQVPFQSRQGVKIL